MRTLAMPGCTGAGAGAGTGCALAKAGGAVLPTMHSGQLSSLLASVLTEPSAWSLTLTMPAALQITSSFCVLTNGVATATPIVRANHSSASRASQGVLRRVCKRVMGRDCFITDGL